MKNKSSQLAVEISSQVFPPDNGNIELILMLCLDYETKRLELVFNVDENTLSPRAQAVFNIAKKNLAENLGLFYILFREVNKKANSE